MARYRWDTSEFAAICTAPLETLARALTARRLQAQGPARLMAQFAAAESLARRFSGMLSADVSEVCVAQSLLPYLWRDGHLGGRGFRVLMTRLPMGRIQSRLDAAWAKHPERASLRDFRAPDWLIDAEAEALEAAEVIITPMRTSPGFSPIRRCVWIGICPICRRWRARGERRGALSFPDPRSRARAPMRFAPLRGTLTSRSSPWAGRWRRSISGVAFVSAPILEARAHDNGCVTWPPSCSPP